MLVAVVIVVVLNINILWW